MKLVKNSSSKVKTTNKGYYENSKNNATKFGIFAKHAVMHWENKNEYNNLLKDLIEEYQPNNVTERHLVVELANIIWCKIRLKYAEKASLQEKLNNNVNGNFARDNAKQALLEEDEMKVVWFDMKKTLIVTDSEIKSKLIKLEERLACYDQSIDILTEKGDYEEGYSALHIDDQNELRGSRVIYCEETYASNKTEDLLLKLKCLKNNCENKIYQFYNTDKVKDQVLGSTFLSDKTMDKYIRYENHLDKKFEKTLVMFFKLRDIRNNGGLSKSVL